MSRSAAPLFAGLLLASAGGALGACGSFSADAAADAGDAAATDATDATDGAAPADAASDAAVAVDAPSGDAGDAGVMEIAKGLTQPWKIAVDSAHLYVTTHATSGQVVQLAHDGSMSVVFATGFMFPTEVSVGPTYVHWLAGSAVWRRVKGASLPAASYTPATPPIGLVTRPSGNIVFATATSGGANGGLTGATPTFDAITPFDDVADMATIALLVDTGIFIGFAATSGPAPVRRYDFGISGPILPGTAGTFGGVTAIAAVTDRVVFAEVNGTVHELKTAVFGSAGSGVLAPAGDTVPGIVLDAVRRKSYWLTANGILHRHDWATEAVDDEAHGCSNPGGIAQDDDNLYWTCPDQGTIERLAK